MFGSIVLQWCNQYPTVYFDNKRDSYIAKSISYFNAMVMRGLRLNGEQSQMDSLLLRMVAMIVLLTWMSYVLQVTVFSSSRRWNKFYGFTFCNRILWLWCQTLPVLIKSTQDFLYFLISDRCQLSKLEEAVCINVVCRPRWLWKKGGLQIFEQRKK